MWMWAYLGLELPDIVAYFVSDLIGLFVFLWLRPTNVTLAITASIFVSFHLFLAWLVISADREKGFSLPVISTIITHLACVVVVYLCSYLIRAVSVVTLSHFLPIYVAYAISRVGPIIALCIPAVAIFERFWLFSGGGKKKEVTLTPEAVVLAAETAAAADAATANDYDEWLQFVARQKPPFPKPGGSLRVEYERWLLAKSRSQPTVSPNVKQS